MRRLSRKFGPERKRYVNKLLSLSAMGDKEKKRWERVVPAMNEQELGQLEQILENEVQDLADVYLRVLQRRQENRSFSYSSEFGSDAQYISTKPSIAPSLSETTSIVEKNQTENLDHVLDQDPGNRDQERQILQKLVKGASFVPEDQKAAMMEVSKYMPSYILKDLQNVIIREGLRNLKKKKKGQLAGVTQIQNRLGDQSKKIRARGKITKMEDLNIFVLQISENKKYVIRSQKIDLNQAVGKTTEVEGIADKFNESILYVDKIMVFQEIGGES